MDKKGEIMSGGNGRRKEEKEKQKETEKKRDKACEKLKNENGLNRNRIKNSKENRKGREGE